MLLRLARGTHLKAPQGEIPASVHYRPATDSKQACDTCAYYSSGVCKMFDAAVTPSYVCDKWEAIKADHAVAPTVEEHNETLRLATARAFDLEGKLAGLLAPILAQAGEEAAEKFQRKVSNNMVAAAPPVAILAAAPNSNSTMIALKPRPEEAAALALPDGEAPDALHITLAYLGQVEGDLEQIREALASIAGDHAPLEGKVGGVGAFGDNGKGAPIILLPSVPGLVELRVDVTQALTEHEIDFGRQHGYQPHVTVDYGQVGDDTDRNQLWESVGDPLHFDALLVVRGDVIELELPFTGTKPLTAAALSLFRTTTFSTDIDRAKIKDARADLEQKQANLRNALESGDDQQIERAKDALADAKVSLRDLVASPQWSTPAADELIDTSALVQTLRTKTDPIRQALVQTTMLPTLSGVGLAFDATNPLTAKVLAQSGSQIQGIADTTRLNVMRIIKESYSEGLSIPDTAKALQVGMRSASLTRATLIARTELAGAVNGGSLAATKIAAQATGVGYQKKWLTAPGAQYPRHENYDGLDGQTVELDEIFEVGESELQFPGDPSGPPEDVCNCRCTMIYLEAGQEVGEADADDAGGDIPGGGDTSGNAVQAVSSATGGNAAVAAESIVQQALVPAVPEAEAAAPVAMVPEGDSISVGTGPFVSPAALEKIDRLGLNDNPEPGPVGRKIFAGIDKPEPDTLDLYQHNGVIDDDRAKVHQAIIQEHFVGKTPPLTAERKAYFTAGGGASGKDSTKFLLDGQETTAQELGARSDTILVNPDTIKAMLPEYNEMLEAGDPYAASGVHEESSQLAKDIMDQAQKEGYSVVFDTTGSSSKFIDRITKLTDDGYQSQVSMMSVPTNEAIMRSLARGDRSGRYVRMPNLKRAHSQASVQLTKWMNDPNVHAWRLYDNAVPRGQPPELVATGGGGEPIQVYDQSKLDAIIAKADE